jgi:hypothetical protein
MKFYLLRRKGMKNAQLSNKFLIPPPSGGKARKPRWEAVVFLVLAFSVSGCRLLSDSLGNNSETENTPPGTSPGEVVDGDNPSIKKKFGVTEGGTGGVTKTFEALSAYIKEGGLSSENNVICLGDWIDLEGGLSVGAYNTAGAFTITNAAITPEYPPFVGYEGKWLRLILVGINSFNGKNGNNEPHVVFQFQNVPVSRRMNSTATNAGGYPASEMRKYLTTVENHEGSGKFLAGLKNAGVPESVLWVPKRYISARITYNSESSPVLALIEDVLWLPTAREMADYSNYSVADETEENQARLEYYDSSAKRIKYGGTGYTTWYWSASLHPTLPSQFYYMTTSGGINADSRQAHKEVGCVPAFCVW